MNIMSLAEVMDKSIEILKKNLSTVALFNLAYGIINFLIIFFMIIIGSIAAGVSIGVFHLVVFPAIVITVIVLLIIAFALTIKVGMIKIASQEFSGEIIDLPKAIRISFQSFLKTLGIVACVILMFLPVIAVFGAAIYFSYESLKNEIYIFRNFNSKDISLILLPFFTMLIFFIIASIYSNLFTFSLHAMIIEKKGVIASLKRSFKLVKHNFWRILGCTIMFYLVYYAVLSSLESFIGVFFGIIYLILKFLNVTMIKASVLFTMAFSYLRWPLNLLSWLVISPVINIMTTMLYFNQRFKKEGLDIELRLKELEKEEPLQKPNTELSTQ